MNRKIIISILLCISTFLVSRVDCSGEPSVLPSPAADERLTTTRRFLELLDLDAERITQIRDADLLKFADISSYLTPWLETDKISYREDLAAQCELAWFLGIISFNEALYYLAYRVTEHTKLEEKLLVNVFADRHAFELKKLVTQGEAFVDDETDLRRHAKAMLSLEGETATAVPYLFLQRALKLRLKKPESPERQAMLKNMMTLHLSAAAAGLRDKKLIAALYGELRQNVPTLFYANLPSHAAAVVVTHLPAETYDVVLVNSGIGTSNHDTNYSAEEKGFHAATMLGMAMTFDPTIRFTGITKKQLEKASYHFGSIEQAYYKDQPEVKAVRKKAMMPWEWSDSQGIGSCTASSIWFTLRFYYHALSFENDLRLSMLDEAIPELAEVHLAIQKVEDKMDADYAERRKVSEKAVPYYTKATKELLDEREKLQSKLRIRRETITAALSEVLQNLIVLFHELHDIKAKTIFWRDKAPRKGQKRRWVAVEELKKAAARQKLLENTIPKIMESFHAFWATQKARKSMSWDVIESDTQTMYSDAVKLIEGKRIEFVKGQLGTLVAKKDEPLDVRSLLIHESLRRILDRILTHGDSPTLRKAIDEHLKQHAAVEEANYLLVLYAAITRNAPLLDFLVNAKGLPLLYRFDAYVPKGCVMLLSDLQCEKDVSRFAALEFKAYGQPLDNFPQLFSLQSEPAGRVVKNFVRTYGKRAPMLRSESQEECDAALVEFAENGELALLAYIAPKASKQARQGVFKVNNDMRVLSIVFDNSQNVHLAVKLGEAIAAGNSAVVEGLFPRWLNAERHQLATSFFKSEGSEDIPEATVPESWIVNASKGRFLEILQHLVPYSSWQHIDVCLKDIAAPRGYTDIAILLSDYSDAAVPDAIIAAAEKGHFEVARALVQLHPSKQAIGSAFSQSVKHGHLDLLCELINSVEARDIDGAIVRAASEKILAVFEMLLEHASQRAIQDAVHKLIGKDSVEAALAKAANYVSPAFLQQMFREAVQKMHYKALQLFMPFAALKDITEGFTKACESDHGSLDIVSLLGPFAKFKAVDSCFKHLIDNEATPANVLEKLLPRVGRKTVFKVYKSPKKDRHLDSSISKAIEERIEGFSTDIAFEHASCFGSESRPYCPFFLETEAKEYGLELHPQCSTIEGCTETIKSLGPKASTVAVETAMTSIPGFQAEEISMAMPRLSQFCYALCLHSRLGVKSIIQLRFINRRYLRRKGAKVCS